VRIEAEELILVRLRESKASSWWMKKPTAVIDSVTLIAWKSSDTFSMTIFDPHPWSTCASAQKSHSSKS